MKKIFFGFLLLVRLILFAQPPAGYYDDAEGKTGYELKTALKNIITNGHTDRGYNNLYTLYQNSDVDNYYENDGTLLDIYSENPNGADSYEYDQPDDKCGTSSQEGDCYNREHIMPQSAFNSGTPMKDDGHFVVPVDGYVNNRRSNYPFGIVNNPTWTSSNGSKVGPNATPGYSGTVFEPIDEFKGDIARMLFYVATRYEDQIAGWSSDMLDGTSDHVFADWFLDLLLQWNHDDPVSQRERDRNEAVYNYQGNRNPFIDHPEWADSIWRPANNNNNNSPSSSQIIAIQDFEGTSPQWNYTEHDSGYNCFNIATNYQNNSTNSLRIKGTNKHNADPYIELDNIDISNYTNVKLWVYFAAHGPDSGDDLWLDISYDNGSTWNSTKLVDGYQNCNLNFGDTSTSQPTTVSPNPYSVDIPDTETQIKVRIRFNERSNKNNTSDYYYVDDIKLMGDSNTSPTITVDPGSLTDFTYAEGNGPSAEQSFTVEGSNLTDDITVTPPTNWEISLTQNSGYQTSPITLSQSGGTVASTTIYTRMVAGLSQGSYSGNISCTSSGATQQDVAVDGTVTDPNAPQVIYSGSFEDGDEAWTYYDGGGTGDWVREDDGGNYSPGDDGHDGTYYAWFYGYNEDADDWLISPSYDFSSYTNVSMNFWSWMRNNGPNVVMKISTDYTGGDPTNATWTDLSPTLASTAQQWTASGDVDLSSIADGQSNVHIAFYYSGNDVDRNWAIDDYEFKGQAANCEEPTTDASFYANSPQNITTTSLRLRWTNGDGDKRIVLMSTSPITFVPTDGETYTGDSSYGDGTQVASDTYVVYNGNGNQVDVTGLTPGTKYYAKIYEYNCTPGHENYYTSGTPASDEFYTNPEKAHSFNYVCVGNNSIDLTWTPPANGHYDGYLLVAREGNTPHSPYSLDPNTNLGDDTDFTQASTYGSTTPYSHILYKGTGTSVTITGLTNGTSYTFALYVYATDGNIYRYSSKKTKTKTINLQDVTDAVGSPGNTEAEVGWTNPDISCFDEILVVANETAGIDFSPSGDGSAYTANSTYAGPNSIVYKGTGTSVTVTGLTNGTTYYFEIFVRNGTEWSPGVEVSATPTTATVLHPGDLAILAVNTDIGNGKDQIAFVCFKDLSPGTKIYLTDNGYEREFAGQWGGTEGVISITRTGSTLPKGTIIVIEGTNNSGNITSPSHFDVYTCGSVDNNWDKTALSGTNIGGFNLNTDDDVWIMQGGIWHNDTDHHSTYDGNVLYGWTESGWDNGVGPGSNGNKWSNLYPGTKCFTTTAPIGGGKVKFKFENYQSDTTNDQLDWIALINTTGNWTTYSNNSDYNSGGYDYKGNTDCPQFTIANDTHTAGKWKGTNNTNWFDCSNWDNLRVPDENTDVVIEGNASNEAIIDHTADYADLYNNIAKTHNLTIDENMWVEANNAGDILEVHGNLLINNNAILDMSDDDSSTTQDGELRLYGNWTNNYGSSGFDKGNSTVRFVGSTPTVITTSDPSGNEEFYHLSVEKDMNLGVTGNLIANGNLTVSNGKTLVIPDNKFVKVHGNITNNGIIQVENKGALIQDDEAPSISSGHYIMKKTAVNLNHYYDYVFWSSPFNSTSFTLGDIVNNAWAYYKFDATLQNGQDYNNPAWVRLHDTDSPQKATGYAISAPQSYGGGDFHVTMEQTDAPFNTGDISVGVHINGTGAQDNDDWNLIGNPYPSAVDFSAFAHDNTNIRGSYYAWTNCAGLDTHGRHQPSGYTVYTAGTGSTDACSGNGGLTAEKYIASGQGFFVEARANGNVVFKNAYRTANNDNFVGRQIPLNRAWFDLANAEKSIFSQILVGFIPGATDGDDRMYDAHAIGASGAYMYLLNGVHRYVIAGYSPDLSVERRIPLGVYSDTQRQLIFRLHRSEGDLNGMHIYLYDAHSGTYHDVRSNDYTFTVPAGFTDNRFELVFRPATMKTDKDVLNSLTIGGENGHFVLRSQRTIKRIRVFDLNGRMLLERQANGASEHIMRFDLSYAPEGVYICQIRLSGGKEVIRKIMR